VKHLLEQVHRTFGRLRKHVCDLGLLAIRPLRLRLLEFGEAKVHGAVGLRGTAKHLEYFSEHLVLATTHVDWSL